MANLVVDTNVLVRLLARDDSEQWLIAARSLRQSGWHLLTTVILETEWVMQSRFGMFAPDWARLVNGLASLPNVSLEEPARLQRALDLLSAGLDFADALHVAALADGEEFVTFDRRLQQLASRHIKHASVSLAI